MSFEAKLGEATAKVGIQYTLKHEQELALRSLYDGKDTVCLLRTGFGKSIIYQLSPFLLEDEIQDALTIVISPLNCIMQDQVMKLCRQGVKACYLDMKCDNGETYEFKSTPDAPETVHPNPLDADSDDESVENEVEIEDGIEAEPVPYIFKVSVSLKDIISGGYRLVYAHPEAFLEAAQGKCLIRTPAFRKRVACVAIDEAHMVAQWGEDFRKAFGRLKDLVALFPKAPTLVVTATASKDTREKLITDLGLQEPTVICTNPDRPNIFYSKVERSPATRQQDDLDSILLPIAKGLKEHGRQYPITILYTNSDNMGYTYRYLQTALGDAQYIGEHKAANRLFGVYHKCVSKGLKEVIVSQLASPTSVKRFIAATVALGMGLDAPAIRKVIHFGCPTTIEQFLQESGRGGRDGAPSEAELHYNRCDIRANRPGHSVAMTEFCKSQDVCLRQQLLRQLDFEAPADRIPCHCCSVCKQKCQCVECALSAVQHIGIE